MAATVDVQKAIGQYRLAQKEFVKGNPVPPLWGVAPKRQLKDDKGFGHAPR